MPVETQFQKFVEARAQQGRPKKEKITHTSMPENVVHPVSTPPPPSPTKITEELVLEHLSICPLDLYKSAMSKAVKENFDQDKDLQAYIEKLPEIFTKVQKLSTKAALFKVGGSRLPVSQPGQVLHRPKMVAIISSTF